jgi:hypothetical protein
VLVGDAHQLNPASPGAVCSPNSMTRGRDTDTACIDRRTDAMPTAASMRAYISRRLQVRNTYSSTQTRFSPAMLGELRFSSGGPGASEFPVRRSSIYH